MRRTWPVIVGGCHRSGTSLLRRMLNAHRDIHCGPEVHFFRDFYGDYLDDPIRSLRFTQSARSALPEPDLLAVLGTAFVELHRRAARQAGKRRWADKNPDNDLYLDQWQTLLGNRWLFVHVVRNPLDTLASIQEAGFPKTIPPERDRRIEHYLRHVQAGLRFAEAHPDRHFRVIYEELVRDPERVLRALMAWLGARFEPGQLDFNRFPQGKGLEDPKVKLSDHAHGGSVGRWRRDQSKEDAEAIWAATRKTWGVIDPQNLYGHRPDA